MVHLKADNFANNVFVRQDSRGAQDVANGKYGKPVGWYATRHNMAMGWTLYNLDEADKIWFANNNESTDGVYRQVTDHGNTSVVKIDVVKGTVDYFNNKKYEDTDKIFWLKHPMKFDRLFIDQGKEDQF